MINNKRPYEVNPYGVNKPIDNSKPTVTLNISVAVPIEDVFRDRLQQYKLGAITDKQYFEWLDNIAKLIEQFRAVK